MEFIHLLPPNTNTLTILAHNLQHFNKFHWETKATLLTFTRIASIFISSPQFIDPLNHNKTFVLLKETISKKS